MLGKVNRSDTWSVFRIHHREPPRTATNVKEALPHNSVKTPVSHRKSFNISSLDEVENPPTLNSVDPPLRVRAVDVLASML